MEILNRLHSMNYFVLPSLYNYGCKMDISLIVWWWGRGGTKGTFLDRWVGDGLGRRLRPRRGKRERERERERGREGPLDLSYTCWQTPTHHYRELVTSTSDTHFREGGRWTAAGLKAEGGRKPYHVIE